ncbi:MAG TPA: BTAD domain-containing putative transcriptional regulator [Aggregatilinea sp.]|uniref:BTAD domain-containing putative transcriptional regulator n=1 Tax=Aggregatilinea sp. TaxID=2806333 RepID=UPI002C1D428A|nr:BTAD domain-containing putative transcriptional regulator [Aggregatilinea sp.]HML20214.1 BTAD domain-containing putative transcriptional regulator [Aggregatilinea sp.]
MAGLDLRWLGYPVVTLDAAPVKLETRKATALLALLSVEPKAHAREAAAAMFWPEHSQQRALRNLRRLLFSLNRSLPDCLIIDHDAVMLAPGFRVDVAEFRAAVEAAQRIPLEDLEDAVNRYGGDFLQSFNLPDCPAFDEWQYFQREQLRRDLGAALGTLAQTYAARGMIEQAVQTACHRVSLDPLDDRAQHDLMALYAGTGQRSAALRQFEVYAALLNTELHQQPDGAIASLHRRIAGEAGSSTAPHEPLFSAKLTIPMLRSGHVTRPRLTQCIAEGAQRALTLVSAPPGSGKTTTVADWATHTAFPVAWLSLDPQDNDAYRFLRYFIAALQSALPDWPAIQPPPHPRALTSFLADLAHKLAAKGPAAALVLDDYHVITAPKIHEAVAFLLQHLSTRLHFILITRADPPLPLGRLRACDQLRELRAADLTFTAEETQTFLAPIAGLSDQDITQLAAGTEGWIAGLQLAALSLRDRNEHQIAAAIHSLAGTHRHILDYLAEEVFNRQTTEMRAFLMRTSIPEQLNAALSDALTGCGDGQAMLEQLESANLFLIPLDDERQWYRYHHLFRDFLQKMLDREQPDLRVALNRCAGEWYRANGYTSEAVSHLLAANDFEQAAALIEGSAQRMLATRHLTTLLAWIGALPAEARHHRVWLTIYQAWAYFFLEDLPAAEAFLQDLEAQVGAAAFEPAEVRTIQANAAIIRSNMAYLYGDHQRTLDLAAQAQDLLDDAPHWLRNRLYFPVGQAYFLLGDLDRAERAWTEAVRLNRHAGDTLANVDTLCFLAALEKFRGRLHGAARLYDEARAIMCACENPDFPVFGSLYVGMGDLLYEWNDMDHAAEQIVTGLEHNRHRGDPLALALSYVALARVRRAQGDMAGAADAFSNATGLTTRRTTPLHIIDAQIQAAAVQFRLENGDLSGARHGLHAIYSAPDCPIRFATVPLHLAQVRLFIAQGEWPLAHALLARLAEVAQRSGHFGSLIKILVLQALVHDGQRDTENALRCLQASFTLAEPEGYTRVYLDEGAPIARLLHEAAGRDIMPTYCARLLGQFSPA